MDYRFLNHFENLLKFDINFHNIKGNASSMLLFNVTSTLYSIIFNQGWKFAEILVEISTIKKERFFNVTYIMLHQH